MKIVAILMAIVGAIFAIVKIAHSHKERKEKHTLQVKTSKAELLELLSQYLDLHEKLDAKFTEEYLASLKEILDEDAYSHLQARLTLIPIRKAAAELGRMIWLGLDEKSETKIDKESDLLSSLAEIERQVRNDITDAKQLLSSRAIEGVYLPIDESLLRDQ